MILQRLCTQGFRNLSPAPVEFSSRCNLIYGSNGQGKTNILESIYLLGTLKSFRHARNRDILQSGCNSAVVSGLVATDGQEREIAVELDAASKRPRLDGKFVAKIGDFFGQLNMVLFSPDDLLMIKGQPDMRRRYLDRSVFSIDIGYLQSYHSYLRVLKNRNALLKSGVQDSLDVWTEELIHAGSALIRRRASYLSAISPLFFKYYGMLAQNDDQVALRYSSVCVDNCNCFFEDAAEHFRFALKKVSEEEKFRKTTLVGPHRDDIIFLLNGNDVKRYASQGELRTIVLALKMAEISLVERKFGTLPLVLLDDLASELDRERTGQMLDFLHNKPIQLFITTTDPNSLRSSYPDSAAYFRVTAGFISPQTTM